MIIEHKLIITEKVNLTNKLVPLLSMLKNYIGGGLKVTKFIIDLFPGHREIYFKKIDTNHNSMETHIEYIHNNSDVRISDITDDSITFTFNMDTCLTYELQNELQSSMIAKSVILKGLQQLRNDKIDSILL